VVTVRHRAPGAGKLLFTPGPLTTSATVKAAMLRDLGSRDRDFVEVVQDVRRRLLAVADVDPAEWSTVLMPGSGTFAVESVITSAVPPGGKLLVLCNGAYGVRAAQIARVAGIAQATLTVPEDTKVDPAAVAAALADDDAITHVLAVHCETTTGLINPVDAIGPAVRFSGRRLDRSFIVDAMSSFGAVPLDLEAAGVDFLITSSNKCVEGVPGFGVVVARRAALAAARHARSLSLPCWPSGRGSSATASSGSRRRCRRSSPSSRR
jgi:2-aminoethylphosphonate-pyruvate transaminase